MIVSRLATLLAAGLLALFCLLPARADEPYFPPGAFDKIAQPLVSGKLPSDGAPVKIPGDFKRGWFSKELAALGEAPLLNRTGAETVYRFTWLRSFDPPMTFRWTLKMDGSSVLIVKRAKSQVPRNVVTDLMITCKGGTCRKATADEKEARRRKQAEQYSRMQTDSQTFDIDKALELGPVMTSRLLSGLDRVGFWSCRQRFQM